MESYSGKETVEPVNGVENMLAKGFLKKIIGPIPENPKACMITWARNPPKGVFVEMVKIAKEINGGTSPVVYVDDICSILDTECSTEEQKERNESYVNFFKNIGCAVVFSSDLYPEKDLMEMLQKFKDKVNLAPGDFLKFLPREKRNLPEISVNEYYHMLLELLLMSKASEENNSILTGPFSEMMVHAHRSTAQNPMTGLITPKLV